MIQTRSTARGLRAIGAMRAFMLAAAMLLALGMAATPRSAAAAAYVGSALAELKPEDKVVVAHPQPVQLIFEFHTKGAPNARATKALKAKVVEAVTASGLFSTVSETPVPNGAILMVVIDNVVAPGDMAKASTQGAVTGATFFIAGSNVTDNYMSTVDYVSGPNAAKISRSARQSVIMQMGLINSPPKDAVKIGGMMDAIYTMTRQVVANPLNDIARDPAFLGAPAATPAAAPAAVSPATTPTPAGPAPAPATPVAPAAAPAPTSTPAPAPASDPTPKA